MLMDAATRKLIEEMVEGHRPVIAFDENDRFIVHCKACGTEKRVWNETDPASAIACSIWLRCVELRLVSTVG